MCLWGQSCLHVVGRGGAGLPLILRGPSNPSYHPTAWVKNFMVNLG